MLLEIRKFGDPVLKRKAEPVEKIDADLLKLLDDMGETMYNAPGIGLAAPQVGADIRAFVIDVDGKLLKFINPEILGYSKEEDFYEEGCLSVPNIYEKVKRPLKIIVKYTNVAGEIVEEELEGLIARVFQHEFDHLNGSLFVEKISSIARNLLANKLTRMRKETLRKIKEVGDK